MIDANEITKTVASSPMTIPPESCLVTDAIGRSLTLPWELVLSSMPEAA